MKLVLDIKNERDLNLLLPLLEGLKIPFTLPKPDNGKAKQASGSRASDWPSPEPHPLSRFVGTLNKEEGEAFAAAVENEFN